MTAMLCAAADPLHSGLRVWSAFSTKRSDRWSVPPTRMRAPCPCPAEQSSAQLPPRAAWALLSCTTADPNCTHPSHRRSVRESSRKSSSISPRVGATSGPSRRKICSSSFATCTCSKSSTKRSCARLICTCTHPLYPFAPKSMSVQDLGSGGYRLIIRAVSARASARRCTGRHWPACAVYAACSGSRYSIGCSSTSVTSTSSSFSCS